MPDSETPEDNIENENNLESDTPNEEVTQEQTPTARPRRQRTTRSRQSGPANDDSGVNVPAEQPPAPRLLETYRTEIVSTMMSEFGYQNTMRVPRIRKVTLNIGLGEALTLSLIHI